MHRSVLCLFSLFALHLLGSSCFASIQFGTITDFAGDPLQAVVVEARTESESFTELDSSDEKGYFWFEVPPGTRLRFSKRGYLSRILTVTDDSSELQVRLSLEGRVFALCMDGEGTAIPEVWVRFVPWEQDKKPEEDADWIREGKCDANGRLLVEELEPGKYEVHAGGEQLETQHKTVDIQPGKTATAVFQLNRMMRVKIRGSVRDLDGKPIPTAVVGTLGRDEAERGELVRPVSHTHNVLLHRMKVDEKGRFEIELEKQIRLDSQRASVTISLICIAPGFAPSIQRVRVPWGSITTEQDFHMGPEASLLGVVIDETGLPVPGIAVAVVGDFVFTVSGEPAPPWDTRVDVRSFLEHGDRHQEIVTDEEGRFRIGGLREGKYLLFPWQRDHCDSERLNSDFFIRSSLRTKTKVVEVHLSEGESKQDVRIDWWSGETVHGRVENEQGEPVEGAKVYWGKHHRAHQVQTGEDGAFRFRGVDPEKPQDLIVRAEGYARSTTEKVASSDEPVTIRLIPAGGLEGQVYDANSGQPISAFSVTMRPMPVNEGPKGSYASRQFSSSDGDFAFPDISPGIYRMKVSASGYLSTLSEGVEVRSLETTPVGANHLQRGKSLEVVVVDRQNKPIAGANVEALSPADLDPVNPKPYRGARRFAGSTDAEGRMRRSGVSAGEFKITVSHPAYTKATALARVREEDEEKKIEVVLGGGGRLEVLALDAQGSPLPAMFVQIKGVGEAYETRGDTRSTNEAGKVVFPRVLPGSYEARLYQGRSPWKPVEIVEGQRASLTLQEVGTLLRGQLRFRGQPVLSPRVWVRNQGDSNMMCKIVGHGYDCGSLQPGEWTLGALAEVEIDSRPQALPVSLQRQILLDPDTTERIVDLEFPDYTVRGVVQKSSSGDPVSGMYVHLKPTATDAKHRGGYGMTNLDGSFEILVDALGEFQAIVTPSIHGTGTPMPLKGSGVVSIPASGKLSGMMLETLESQTVYGIVSDEHGDPIAGAVVSAWSSDSVNRRSGVFYVGFAGHARSRTNSRGEFELKELPGIDSYLVITHTDHAGWVLRLSEQTPQPVEIQLKQGGSLEIVAPKAGLGESLSLRSSMLPTPIIVSTHWSMGEGISTTATGNLRIDRLPAGQYAVMSKGRDGTMYVGTVTIEERQSHRLELSRQE